MTSPRTPLSPIRTFDPPPSSVTAMPLRCAMRSASTISSDDSVSSSHSAGPPTLNVVNGASGTSARKRSAPKRATICVAKRPAIRRQAPPPARASALSASSSEQRFELDPVARRELCGERQIGGDHCRADRIATGRGVIRHEQNRLSRRRSLEPRPSATRCEISSPLGTDPMADPSSR